MARSTVLLILTVVVALFSVTYAAVPRLITYQGKLTDMGGAGYNGDYDMVFRLYEVETGGIARWGEFHYDVLITHGLFDVVLGSNTPLNLTFDRQYWLEIQVHGTILEPRIKLTTSPYALRAAIADSVAGGTIGGQADTLIAHWDSLRNIPADIADGDDVIGVIDTMIAHWDSLRGAPWIVNGTHMHSALSGNVGIGYDPPTQKLDVHGNTKTHQIHLAAPGTTGWQNQIAWFDDDRTTINHVLYMDANDGDKLKLSLGYGGSSAERVFDFTSGRVGIGTSEPDARLHIHNGTDCDTLGGGYIVLGDVGGENIVIDNNEIMARNDSSTSPLYIQHDGGNTDFGGNVILRHGISDGASYGNINQVIVADGAGGWNWQNSPHVEFINDLTDVDTAGVVDGQVLKWVAVANQWRPANDVGGSTGADNWGTQVVRRDSSLIGDGTPGHRLGIDWDTLDAHINRYVDLNYLRDVNDIGVSDGEVLTWIATAGEWRPMALSEGGLGDNWGTQLVQSNASLIGDGTVGNLLSVNWDTLRAYPDTMIVLNDLKDVKTDSLNYDFKLAWDHDSSRWVGKFDNDGDMTNELIDSLIWEPVDSAVDTNWRTLRIIEHSVIWDVEIPVNQDSLADNSIFELKDVDTTGLAEGTVMRWTFIETTYVGGETTAVYMWIPITIKEIFAEHKLSDLSDVNDSVPIDKHVLQWNAATETWGPGIDPSEFINVWRDYHGYIAPLIDDIVDIRIFDFDSSMAISLIETTGVATDTWYGMYIDRRGVAASDGYGLYSHAGTDGGIAPGSEFYGVKGVANGGHVVYGLYGDGDYPGAGGTGYGAYARGKTYGVYGYGTGTSTNYGVYAVGSGTAGYGIYASAPNGMAGYFHDYVGINTNQKNAKFEVYTDQDGNSIPSAIFRIHDSGFDDTLYFHQKWGGGGAGSRALIHAKHNGETVFMARPDNKSYFPGELYIGPQIGEAKLQVSAVGNYSVSEAATHPFEIWDRNHTLYMGADSTSQLSYIQSVGAGAYRDLTLNARGGNVAIGDHSANGNKLFVHGPYNDGTHAAVKIVDPSNSMLIDGNGIDSDGSLYLQLYSHNPVTIATNTTNGALTIDGTHYTGIDGLHIMNAQDNGIEINNAVSDAIWIHGTVGTHAIHINASPSDDGIHIATPADCGVEAYAHHSGLLGHTDNSHDHASGSPASMVACGAGGDNPHYGSYDGIGIWGHSHQDWDAYGFGSVGVGGWCGGLFHGGSHDVTHPRSRPIPDIPTLYQYGQGVYTWGGIAGIVSWGDYFGQFVKGEVIGSYIDGTSLVKGTSVEINDIGGEHFATYYHNVSTQPTVYASGYGNLSGGSVRMEFGPEFSELLDGSQRPVVTITPIGRAGSIYIASVDARGFTVMADDPRTAIEFSWMAIGVKHNKPEIPAEMLDKAIYEDFQEAYFDFSHPEYDYKFKIVNGQFEFWRDDNDPMPENSGIGISTENRAASGF